MAWLPCLLLVLAALLFPSPWSDWHRIMLGPGSRLPHTVFSVTAVIRPDGIDVIAPWDPEAPGSDGDLWSQAASGEIKAVSVSYIPRRYLHGLLGLTQEVLVIELSFYEILSDEQSKAVKEAVLQRLEMEPAGTEYRVWAAELREFDRLYGGARIRTLPSGYAWNTVVVIAAVIAVFGGLDATVRGPGWIRAYRRRRLAKQGRCPRCGYSMAGIASACPECGEPPYAG